MQQLHRWLTRNHQCLGYALAGAIALTLNVIYIEMGNDSSLLVSAVCGLIGAVASIPIEKILGHYMQRCGGKYES